MGVGEKVGVAKMRTGEKNIIKNLNRVLTNEVWAWYRLLQMRTSEANDGAKKQTLYRRGLTV